LGFKITSIGPTIKFPDLLGLTGVASLFIYGMLIGLIYNRNKKMFGFIYWGLTCLMLGLNLGIYFFGLFYSFSLVFGVIIAIILGIIGAIIGWNYYKNK